MDTNKLNKIPVGIMHCAGNSCISKVGSNQKSNKAVKLLGYLILLLQGGKDQEK
jgi:hypothetical protein